MTKQESRYVQSILNASLQYTTARVFTIHCIIYTKLSVLLVSYNQGVFFYFWTDSAANTYVHTFLCKNELDHARLTQLPCSDDFNILWPQFRSTPCTTSYLLAFYSQVCRTTVSSRVEQFSVVQIRYKIHACVNLSRNYYLKF